jgi:hypothetical protein
MIIVRSLLRCCNILPMVLVLVFLLCDSPARNHYPSPYYPAAFSG